MRIAYGSDLHIEFYKDGPSLKGIKGADLLILAGDIDVGYDKSTGEPKALNYAKDCSDFLDCPVVIINGNHEYYKTTYETYLEDCRTYAASLDRVHFLENDRFEIGNIRLLGCTLWTDMDLYSTPTQSGKEAENNISDYFLIHTQVKGLGNHGGGRATLKANDTISFNETSKNFLSEELNKPFEGRTIVVSHFPPVPFSHPRYEGDRLAPYFTNDWGRDIHKGLLSPDIWICGHTHHNGEVTICHTRITSAQRGYPNEMEKFQWGLIEVCGV